MKIIASPSFCKEVRTLNVFVCVSSSICQSIYRFNHSVHLSIYLQRDEIWRCNYEVKD